MAELTMLKDVNKIPHPNVIRFIGGCSLAGTRIILIRVTNVCAGKKVRFFFHKSWPVIIASNNVIIHLIIQLRRFLYRL